MNLLVPRVAYGVSLLFLAISNLLFSQTYGLPTPNSLPNILRLFETLIQVGLLIIAIIMIKNKLFSILLLGVNALIAVIHLFQFRYGIQSMIGLSDFGFQLKGYTKFAMNYPGWLVEYPWAPAEIFRIVSAVFTIIGVLLVFLLREKAPKAVNQIGSQVPLNKPAPSTSSATSISGDAIEQIEKLGDLLAKGLLTQEEFNEKKKQILGI
ncbi:MAG: hypothetical protein RL589_210 [Actinomycetota bacterium]